MTSMAKSQETQIGFFYPQESRVSGVEVSSCFGIVTQAQTVDNCDQLRESYNSFTFFLYILF